MLDIIIGKKSVLDALKSSTNNLSRIILLRGKRVNEIIDLANKQNCRIEYWSVTQFNKYFGSKINHQFCFAILNKKKNWTLEMLIERGKTQTNPIIVILDEINDPQNFGTIIRTCAAANVLGIIHKKNNQAPQNLQAIKASLGATSIMPTIAVSNLVNTINLLKNSDYWILVTSTDKSAIPYWSIPKDRSYAIVFGNESDGVSRIVSKNADYLITIPISSKIQSLNVSTATGIILFDLLRIRSQ